VGILQALLRVRKEAGKIGFVQAGSPTPTPDILGRSGSDDSDQPHGRKKKKKKKGPGSERRRSCQGAKVWGQGTAGRHPPFRTTWQGGPRERLRSGCSGSAASVDLPAPRSGCTPPYRDSRPVTGPPPLPRQRCCCRCRCCCRYWNYHCCTGPHRWRSRSGTIVKELRAPGC
jgi:hypothetical protein